MPAATADLSIEARWTLPMTGGAGLLARHSIVIRDGHIVDVLPQAEAARKYAPASVLQRPEHLVMPGLIDISLRIPAAPPEAGHGARDAALAGVAAILRAGITCAVIRCDFPEDAARASAEQHLRTVIGLPVAPPRAQGAEGGASDLSRALALRDAYQGHPLVSTAFAPSDVNALPDAVFARIATLANELDARIVLDLHASAAELAESQHLHAARPLERLDRLGLLTPALLAVHMSQVTAEDIERTSRAGVSVGLCPLSSLEDSRTLPPGEWLTYPRVGVGSGGAPYPPQALWINLALIAAMAGYEDRTQAAVRALTIATRGAAAALGLDPEIGSLEAGKWADLCCIDLGGPRAHLAAPPLEQLVFGGGRDMVSDVWVAGRQLVADFALTRLDWPAVAARAEATRG